VRARRRIKVDLKLRTDRHRDHRAGLRLHEVQNAVFDIRLGRRLLSKLLQSSLAQVLDQGLEDFDPLLNPG
jgi:hypothetical protein